MSSYRRAPSSNKSIFGFRTLDWIGPGVRFSPVSQRDVKMDFVRVRFVNVYSEEKMAIIINILYGCNNETSNCLDIDFNVAEMFENYRYRNRRGVSATIAEARR